MATGIPHRRSVSSRASSGSSAEGGGELPYETWASDEDVLRGHASQLETIYGDAENRPENVLIWGDNAPVLARLLENGLAGSVDLIYIDPPFATGARFQSRTQVDAYLDPRAGAEYFEFLRRRLVLLREALSPTGSIYLHLDHTIVFEMKLIMDEVFGAKNFRSMITRQKCNPKNYTSTTYGNIADYLLFYTKTDDYTWNRPFVPWAEGEAKEYRYSDPDGRRYMKVPVHAPGERKGETGKTWRGVPPPPGKHWQYAPEKLDELDRKGLISWSSTGNPRRKIYLDENPGKPVQNIWTEFRDAHNQMIEITGFPTEKNPDMIRRIVTASSNPGDLVLDCFSGSGTTLHVAAANDRRWIGIDESHVAIATTLRRFSSGTEAMGTFAASRGAVEAQPKLFARPDVPDRDRSGRPPAAFTVMADRTKTHGPELATIVDELAAFR